MYSGHAFPENPDIAIGLPHAKQPIPNSVKYSFRFLGFIVLRVLHINPTNTKNSPVKRLTLSIPPFLMWFRIHRIMKIHPQEIIAKDNVEKSFFSSVCFDMLFLLLIYIHIIPKLSFLSNN
jgi:hypothetical protein